MRVRVGICSLIALAVGLLSIAQARAQFGPGGKRHSTFSATELSGVARSDPVEARKGVYWKMPLAELRKRLDQANRGVISPRVTDVTGVVYFQKLGRFSFASKQIKAREVQIIGEWIASVEAAEARKEGARVKAAVASRP